MRLRRMVMATTVFGAVSVVIATGVSFTATNDTSTVAITPGGVGGGVTDFATVSFAANATISGVRPVQAASGTTFVAPAWSPTIDQVVPVNAAGDLAIINATGTTGNILVTVSLTNPVGLSKAYSYFNLPIDVYKSTDAGTTWTRQLTGAGSTSFGGANGVTYLNLTNGFVSFLVAGGANTLYELHVPKFIPTTLNETITAPPATGTVPTGSFYTIDTTSSGIAIAPAISVTVTAAG